MRIIILLFVCLLGCSGEIEIPAGCPVVITEQVTNITESGAEFVAHITKSNSPSQIIKHGFVWGVGKNPTLESFHIVIDGAPGEKFSSTTTRDLSKGNYYVRAFVQTNQMTVYGNVILFVAQGSAPAAIASVTPSEGFDGTEVTLTFSNHVFAGSESIMIGGVLECPVLSAIDNVVKVRIPPSSMVGTYTMLVAHTSIRIAPIPFKILAPAITSIPEVAHAGEVVVFPCENLDKADHILLQFQSSTTIHNLNPTILSPTELQVTIPPFPGTHMKVILQSTKDDVTKIQYVPGVLPIID